ncbi:MAG: SDR family oxidoreductase [Actinomycetaceae bacterium]|nr:SDR family oxidoreductase [Actinomycetaceae bacterium]
MSYQPVRNNSKVLVTGASSGIGADTVRLLCEQGWDVVACARREDRLQALAEETGCHYYACDLRDRVAVEKMAKTINADTPVTSVVINAGGAIGLEHVAHGDIDNWRAMYERNVITALNTAQVFLPEIRNGGGDLVFITSTAANETYPGGAGYTAAKHAEAMIVRTLRMELAGEDVRLIEICPGLVHTEEFSLVRLGSKEAADKVYEGVAAPLLGRDIADVVAYCLSRPPHVNLDKIVIRPVEQANANLLTRTGNAKKA